MKLGLVFSFFGLMVLISMTGLAAETVCDEGAGIEACAELLEDQLSSRGTVGMVVYCCDPKEVSGRTFFKIVGIRKGMALAEAGVEVNDYISLVGAGALEVNPRSREDFGKLHETLKRGDPVQYLVQREGEAFETDVVAGPPTEVWIEFELHQRLSFAGFSNREITRWFERRHPAGYADPLLSDN